MVIDRFIEKYGTHIVVGLSVGGQDVLLVRQDKSSTMEASQLKQHIDELGDQLFTGSCTFSSIHAKSKEHKRNKVFLFPYSLCIHYFLKIKVTFQIYDFS